MPPFWKEGQTTTMGATFSTLCKKCVGSLRPLLTSTEKMQETGPTVYHPYLRRLGFPSICGCHSKDSPFFSVIQDPECCGQGFELSTSHTQSNTLHPELPNLWLAQAVHSKLNFSCKCLSQFILRP